MASVGKSVEVCCTRSICSLIFAVTFSFEWPTLMVTMPPRKSRYCFPSRSHTYCPLAWSITSGSLKYVVTQLKMYSCFLRMISSLVMVSSKLTVDSPQSTVHLHFEISIWTRLYFTTQGVKHASDF